MTDLAALQARAMAKSAPEADEGLIVCDNLVRVYRTEGVEVQALQGLDLTVDQGELLAVVGASGSGKSTLLGILSGLDLPTAGRARVARHDLLAMKRRERLDYRRRTVGFVWQQTGRNLLPYLTALENVTLPMGYARVPRAGRAVRAMELLDLLGVADCRNRRPGELSGGQQQRVAIAVAGANTPQVLFADEPTGELDTASGEEVFAALRRTNAELGVTVLIVTHDPAVSEQVRRTVRIRDGRTATEVLRPGAGGAGSEPGGAEEYAVLDRAGRLQLPREYTERYGLHRRVRLTAEPDHVGVWADRGAGQEAASAADGPAGQDGQDGQDGDEG
ncbi:ABC transporter ATP-binding protein [Actinacidiphila bryophytorum]|uniref:ABC-type lipoprotein export system, ATPase component n=1 Tax=Actinacidiphila bryophytorum TaxID=1436133 RepID=A0A9W4MF30_9ACTN|nr:ABC transporter ATP-binding protein [Actinacidiphila bryophytorum]MBM9436759.1 ABC transporter ATP-binding protein [Actinacidiphila bryophytorum]MBN6544061.1 ABC transporter ATP-binding protein [Actinacidiphila bryophytorum]CAG7654234.1 ABC-type lipoprotein export system, ATPase component [Actinacidiphila bryophytorum]